MFQHKMERILLLSVDGPSVTGSIDWSFVSMAKEGVGGQRRYCQTLSLWLCELQNHASPPTVQLNMREHNLL